MRAQGTYRKGLTNTWTYFDLMQYTAPDNDCFPREHFIRETKTQRQSERLQCKTSLGKLANKMFVFDRTWQKVPAFFQSAAFKITSKGIPKLTAFEVEAPLKLSPLKILVSIPASDKTALSFCKSCRWNYFVRLTIRNENLRRVKWLSYARSPRNIM